MAAENFFNYSRPLPDQYLQNYAATIIQRYFRGFLCRREFSAKKRAAIKIEGAWIAARVTAFTADAAARAIQAAWQGFRNKRIYQYYRDLIQFRERGDPREMLRSINPREAQLADPASGIHVRFRLGGTTFPPLVFYKIFTHRVVVDINSFCPRAYADEVKLSAAEVHNKKKKSFEGEFELNNALREYLKPDGTIGYRSTRGWYERLDHNGWRPISERILVEEDPITTMTKLRRAPFFHHNPGVRREERIRLAKQKKRAWLQKLYQDGLQGALQVSSRKDGSAPLDDLDLDELDPLADELVAWTQHLDFEAYVGDWTSLACTLGSEAFVPEQDSCHLEPLPAPSHDLKGAMATAGVPLQPFKGGVTPAAGSTTGLYVK